MALDLKFTIVQSCDSKTLSFYETTGIQTAANSTGWNTGSTPSGQSTNPATTDATSVSIVITMPDGTEHTISTSTTDKLDNFPDSSGTEVAALTGTDISEDDGDDYEWADGLYQFKYSAVVGAITYSKSYYIFLMNATKCCMYGMFADIDYQSCIDGSDTLDKAFEAFTYYKAAIYAAKCGKTDKATRLKDHVNKLCGNLSNCTSCD